MFTRRNKPKTIDELPSRYLGLSGPSPVPEEEPTAPRKIGGMPMPAFLLVGALLACLVVAVVFVYRATVPQLAPPPARDLNAEAVETILDSARVYHQQNDLGKAEIVLSAGVREHPDDQQMRIAYAETLMMSDQLDSAFYEYTEALRIGPRDADLEFVAGTIASKLGEVALAEAHFTAARNKDPTEPSYGMFLAQVQLQQHKYDDAIVSLIQVRPLDPDNAMIYGTLAEIYTKKNDVNLALNQIRIARELEPQRSAWKIVEARLFKRHGEPEKALLLFNSLSDAERDSQPILRNRAECFGMLKRPEMAASMYQSQADAHPDDADLAFEAAVWSDKAGQHDLAIRYGERARLLGHELADKLVKRLVAVGG
jgi:tetratricopeptide (TPR) repeat protein